MFFLKQLFRARERMQQQPENPEGYMSILEHLEALRRTIINMLITLAVAMLACFFFVEDIMDFLRYPAACMTTRHEAAHLPAGISAEDWQQAKEAAAVLPTLPPAAAEALAAELPQRIREPAAVIPTLRAALLLPQDKRIAWLQQNLPTAEQQSLAVSLLETQAILTPAHKARASELMGAFQPGEAFMLSVRLAFFSGIILAFPLLMHRLMQFLIPGLTAREKRIIYKSAAWGFLLFIGGCAFAYWGVLPRVLSFFYEYSLRLGIENEWRIGYYLSFAIKLIFVFGVIFELPVIIIPLIKLGILNAQGMQNTRGYALISCFALALLLAPAPDPATMLLMALPMYALYELCIFFARIEQRKQRHAPLRHHRNKPN